MKHLIFLALLLCINSAAGLQCQTCVDGGCSSPLSVTCPGKETMCVSVAVKASFSVLNVTQSVSYLLRSCVPGDVCPSVGTQSFSFNTGDVSVLAGATCCNSDNCNTGAAETMTPPAGSTQCYGCNPVSGACSASVSCNGLETHCFGTQVAVSANVTAPVYGCVSENLCDPAVLSYVPFLPYNVTAPISCCGTSNCNAPGATAPPTATNTTASTASSGVGPALPLLGLLLMMLCF